MVPDVSRLMDVSVVLDGSVLISYNNNKPSFNGAFYAGTTVRFLSNV